SRTNLLEVIPPPLLILAITPSPLFASPSLYSALCGYCGYCFVVSRTMTTRRGLARSVIQSRHGSSWMCLDLSIGHQGIVIFALGQALLYSLFGAATVVVLDLDHRSSPSCLWFCCEPFVDLLGDACSFATDVGFLFLDLGFHQGQRSFGLKFLLVQGFNLR